MGCSASKDSGATNLKDGRPKADRSMSMPHQSQSSNKSDNGYHVVALTSSTYGILKVETPKDGGGGGGETDRMLNKSRSDADAAYEKLKQFDVPENMVSKPWSEVSLTLPKIPPATKTGSPRRLPQEVAPKSDTETIDMWELMDGLDEESLSSTAAPSKLKFKKPIERPVGSPLMIKPFERSITFSSIHTLSELDSGDPNMAIAPGSGNNFMRSSSEAASGNYDNTNTKAFKARSQVSSPVVQKPDEIVVKLTPLSSSSSASSSPPRRSLQPKVGTQSGAASPRPPPQQQPGDAFRALPPHAAATIKEVSNLLLPPASPLLRPKSGTGSLAGGKLSGSHIPKSPMLKAAKSLGSSSEAQQPKAAAVKEPNGRRVSTSAGNATEVSPGHHGDQKSLGKVMPTKSPSPPSRGGGAKNNNVTRQISSPGRVRAAAAALSSKESLANPQSQSNSKRAVSEAAVAESDSSRGGGLHFATPIHVLSLAATYEMESQKDIDLKAPPMSPGPAKMMKSSGGKLHSVPPSPLLKSVSSPGQGITPKNAGQESSQASRSGSSTAKSSPKALALSPGVQNAQRVGSNLSLSHTSSNQAPAEGKHRLLQGTGKGGSPVISRPAGASRGGKGVSPGKSASPGTTKSAAPIDSPAQDTVMDPDLLASFEEALELFSEDDWNNAKVGTSGRGEEVVSISGRREGNASLDSSLPTTPDVKLPPPPSSSQHETRSPMVSSSGGKKIVASSADKAARRPGLRGSGATVKRSPSPAKQKKVRPDPWERFDKKCPPAGEERVVLYTTSLRGIRKTFEDCNNARFILQGLNVAVDERDVSIHAEFRQELKDLMMGKPVPVPQVFIKGRYIGGMEEITKLHEDGTLATLVDGLPAQLSREDCDGCGGVRFVPCSDCSGSCKVINESNEVVRCPECNENGLMRCPICY